MLLAVARPGRVLDGLRRRTVMSAGSEGEDRDDEEQCGDVFHTMDNRGWRSFACMILAGRLPSFALPADPIAITVPNHCR